MLFYAQVWSGYNKVPDKIEDEFGLRNKLIKSSFFLPRYSLHGVIITGFLAPWINKGYLKGTKARFRSCNQRKNKRADWETSNPSLLYYFYSFWIFSQTDYLRGYIWLWQAWCVNFFFKVADNYEVNQTTMFIILVEKKSQNVRTNQNHKDTRLPSMTVFWKLKEPRLNVLM